MIRRNMMLIGALACATVACSDGGGTTTVSPAPQISVTLRPVLACTSGGAITATAPSGNADEAAGMVVLEFAPGDLCQLGPTRVTGAVFAGDAKVEQVDTRWVVNVTIRAGATGIDLVNELASKCYGKEAACPSGDLAVVIDGKIVMKATVQTPTFDQGTLQFGGDYTQVQAHAVADSLNHSH